MKVCNKLHRCLGNGPIANSCHCSAGVGSLLCVCMTYTE